MEVTYCMLLSLILNSNPPVSCFVVKHQNRKSSRYNPQKGREEDLGCTGLGRKEFLVPENI